MDIRHCAERICELRFGAAKIGEYGQKLKDVSEEILTTLWLTPSLSNR